MNSAVAHRGDKQSREQIQSSGKNRSALIDNRKRRLQGGETRSTGLICLGSERQVDSTFRLAAFLTTIPGFGPRSPANFKCLKWSLRSTAILRGLVESRITDPCCAELMRNFPSYAKIAQRLRPAARSSSGRDGCQGPGQNTFTENDSSRPRSSPLGVLSTKSGSEKEARFEDLDKAMHSCSEALKRGLRGTWWRSRSIVTLSCSRRSTPRIPWTSPPHALPIALKSARVECCCFIPGLGADPGSLHLRPRPSPGSSRFR